MAARETSLRCKRVLAAHYAATICNYNRALHRKMCRPLETINLTGSDFAGEDIMVCWEQPGTVGDVTGENVGEGGARRAPGARAARRPRRHAGRHARLWGGPRPLPRRGDGFSYL
jgi:hypothetical protein